MKDTTKKRDFIELRAKNKSLQSISNEIGVSKPTLIKWNKDFKYEVKNLNNIEREALNEEYKLSMEQRIEYLGNLQKKVLDELKSRDLKDVKTDKLLEMLIKTSDKLQEAKGDFYPSFKTSEEIEKQKLKDKQWESIELIP